MKYHVTAFNREKQMCSRYPNTNQKLISISYYVDVLSIFEYLSEELFKMIFNTLKIICIIYNTLKTIYYLEKRIII